MAMQWNDSFLVHVSEVDTQHKKLVELVNSLEAAMRAGKGREILGGILASLIQYTQYHFSAEERLMQAKKYPDYPKHLIEHQKLTHTVVEFKQQFDAGNKTLTIPTMEFLQNWLVNHILHTDIVLGKYLSAQGVK
jgi:hemerythrin-like metal-binding protein